MPSLRDGRVELCWIIKLSFVSRLCPFLRVFFFWGFYCVWRFFEFLDPKTSNNIKKQSKTTKNLKTQQKTTKNQKNLSGPNTLKRNLGVGGLCLRDIITRPVLWTFPAQTIWNVILEDLAIWTHFLHWILANDTKRYLNALYKWMAFLECLY